MPTNNAPTLANGTELEDAIMFDVLTPQEALYIASNIVGGKIRHVYRKSTINRLMADKNRSSWPSPVTRHQFNADNVMRLATHRHAYPQSLGRHRVKLDVPVRNHAHFIANIASKSDPQVKKLRIKTLPVEDGFSIAKNYRLFIVTKYGSSVPHRTFSSIRDLEAYIAGIPEYVIYRGFERTMNTVNVINLTGN